MFFPEGQIRVYVYGQPVDMRRSYVGLYALARNAMGQNPLSGHLYAFINRRGTLSIPTVFIKRILPAQTQQIDGKTLLAKAKVPDSNAKTWTLELAPLFRVEAWKVAQPAPGVVVAALGYALPGEKSAIMRVEYLRIGEATYGLRSMPTS